MDLYHISFSSSILIIFILILKAFSGYRLPRKTFTLLWKIVLIRLLVPVTIKVPIPDLWITAKKKVNLTGEALLNLALTGGTEGVVNPAESGSYKISGAYILFIIWITVASILLCLFLFKYIMSRRKVNEAMPSANDYAKNWVSSQRIRRSVRILTFDRIMSPVTVGVLKPKIILPKNMEMDRGKRLEYVLCHEMVHIRRLDIVWKLLSMVMVCLYWFNPLIWLMYKQFNQDIETACDEKVIKLFGTDAKPDYAYAIIQLMEKKPQVAFMYSGFGEKPVEERIVSIMKLGKTTKKSFFASGMVLLLSTMVFFTTVSAGNNFGGFNIAKGTVGENGTVHTKNPESVNYFPVNKNGYTYGKYDSNLGVMPDLVYIEVIKGKDGYVYADEYLNTILNNRPDLNTQDLDSYNKQQQEANRVCNIYLSDGETMIGTYN
ncbi:Signal transducer regulating beta-lactamase production, contains metallopeptidase domain [Anaerocolumna jejuensis DSM 15929]|uniref:Signal transducer regulating beta-lactamase production, contains metallopeptidase domain n=1 Tax=Anaerocolumna jejuensis DSM 15929 TaxID=1121322 RepID=A0A1M6QTY8_9FIRM|nr:M56 family metallopeptidase [Anaerocolumna jejuensis]SHK23497.1 Signal transducer regulating beta-lactamase production, contains metallopeptidase domain [Anaerocolumna jejuensis DSM 15929]